MKFISEEINNYCLNFTTDESEQARAIRKKTVEELKYSNMLSGKMVGQFLATLIKISGARKALEVGCFTGYSALRVAEALPEDGELITCEYNERYARMAQESFDKSKHGQKITLKLGKALQTLPEIDETFDFIFLDADKANYPEYYKLLLPKLGTNGLLLVDNVLWSGRVLEQDDEQDDKTKAINRLNKIIANDDKVEQVMLSLRDGLMMVRKK